MQKLKTKIALLTLSIAAATGAYAAPDSESGVLIGLDVGRAEARKNCDGVADCDDSDTSIRGDIGYQFDKNWSAELGYTSFGTLFKSDDSNFNASQRLMHGR